MKLLVYGFIFWSVAAQAAMDVPSPSATLVEEVLSQTPADPHRYDWRNDALTLEVGYGNIAEYNSFRSNSYQLGFSTPTGGGWIFRAAARQVNTRGTGSSDKLALTPFSQAAQPSHHEFMLGLGFALLDGRSQSALTPRLTDINHALYALLGAQYNYFLSREDEPIPGMHAVYYDWVVESGLRWQIYFPHALGVGFEWAYAFPLAHGEPDLGSWQRFTGVLSWSFSSTP